MDEVVLKSVLECKQGISHQKSWESNSFCEKKTSKATSAPGSTTMVKHDDHDMTWYDHGKIMAW